MSRLHSPLGAELDLRSQLLFLDPPPARPRDPLTAAFSWHYRYLHESSHWVRFHGSTIGILLTLLRRTRDALAAHLLGQLTRHQATTVLTARREGRRMLSGQGGVLAECADAELVAHGYDWLDLRHTYQELLDPGTSTADMPSGLGTTHDAVARGLYLTWQQSAGRGMFGQPAPGIEIEGSAVVVRAGDERLTTRLLLECAAVLDEVYSHALGSARDAVDPSLFRMLSSTFDGLYGLPYRIAERLAGRDVGPAVVLALIDFALNPVVPGLHPGVAAVDWAELDPPSRYVTAARHLARRRVALEDSPPAAATLHDCHQQWEVETGLRFGRVAADLTDFSTLGEVARHQAHVVDIIPNATLLYATRLLQERRASPHLISQFGLNFVGAGALRFVDPDGWGPEGSWWLFPPLRVIEGEYCWPADRVDQDEATTLLIGSAISAAFDDIVYGVGRLDTEHLPLAVLRQPGELAALNEALRTITKLDIDWSVEEHRE